jgi:hypothetical protein
MHERQTAGGLSSRGADRSGPGRGRPKRLLRADGGVFDGRLFASLDALETLDLNSVTITARKALLALPGLESPS